ncbi:hypothetical protein GCM10027614_15250 [Micromonospora vulcania]
MDVRDVDPVQPQPGQALGVRAAYPGGGEVELWGEVRRLGPELLPVVSAGDQQPADLGGEGELVAWFAGEDRAGPPLGQAAAVERGGVEVAQSELPRRLDGGVGDLVAHDGEEPTDRGEAEPEPGHRHVGTPQRHPFRGPHPATRWSSWMSRITDWLILS